MRKKSEEYNYSLKWQNIFFCSGTESEERNKKKSKRNL
jgi:hypothetical protein